VGVTYGRSESIQWSSLTAEILDQCITSFCTTDNNLHRDTVDAEEEDDLFVLFQQIATAVSFILQPFLKRKESILSWQKKKKSRTNTRGSIENGRASRRKKG
jgi:hypothetical protein